MNKSICFVTGALGNAGGQEYALSNLTNEFAKKGHRVTIICLFRSDVFFEISPSINIIMPKYKRTPNYDPKKAKRMNKFNNKYLYALKLIPYLRHNIVKINPDTVVSFGDWFNSYVVIATSLLNKPVYLTNRMGPNINYGKFMELFNRFTYTKATAMIVQTNRAKAIMQNKYKIKDIRVVPNGIKPMNIVNRKHENVIITVGRLNKEKGHSVLIEAFSRLKNKRWRLDIVGHGPERDNLEKQVSNLGIQSRVRFYGYRKNFQDLLSAASIFVLPSFYEGFPNALIEAMSVPLTCVSSDCVAGPREIINHGKNGFLFETGNVDALTIILDDLINDPIKLSYYEKNASNIIDNYNFEVISQKFLNEILS
tara:strand:- start:449 stop:1549 length:1101 start_codon:yes stop_codon:yes gene_type:complete